MSLDRLLGTWQISMQHSQLPAPVTGRHEYERVLDGAFVMQRWTYDHPDFPNAIAMLDTRSYTYFDVRGVIRVFEFSIDDAGWSMSRTGDDFWQRSTARFVGSDAIECHGENSSDAGATWQHDYTLTCERVPRQGFEP